MNPSPIGWIFELSGEDLDFRIGAVQSEDVLLEAIVAGPNLEIVADPVRSMQCDGCKELIDVAACPPFTKAACPHCDRIGRVPVQLGSFLLLETLGRGGMGAVYKAQDLTLNRHVAIKVLRKEYGDDGQFLSSFLQEARAAAALNHRNVAQIYSYGQEKGQPYIVMELLESGRLDRMIESDNELGEAFVMSTAVHVAEGLQAANEIGLTHGDIKPANILFNAKSVAKVVDFGLASFAKTQQAKPGEVWGTPYYIAPEKVRGKASDYRADIYSLGGTLFHALAKTAPYEGETAKDVVKARLEAPAASICKHRPDVTAETEAVIARMLERSPGRRYPTYASLLSDLRKADRAAQKAAKQRIQEQAEAVAAAKRAAKRRPVILLTVLSLILVLGSTGAWWLYQQQKPPEPEVVGHILTRDGRLIAVYEDESGGQPARPADPVTEGPAPEPASLSAAQGALKAAADALAGGQRTSADDQLVALMAELDDADPARAQAQLLRAIVTWTDGRPSDAPARLGGLSERTPAALQKLAAYLSGTIVRGDLAAARSSWTPGPRALSDLAMGLSALHEGLFDRASADLDRYVNASVNGWWTALQPLVPQLNATVERWRALESSLDPEQPRYALQEVQKFALDPIGVLRPVVERKRLILEEAVRGFEESERTQQQQRKQRDDERRQAVRQVTAELIQAGQYAAAASEIERVLMELETQEARSVLTLDRDHLNRLASVRVFLAEQITTSPPKQRIAALGGRISGATTEKISMARIDGGGERSWAEVSPTLYLKLLDYYITNPELGNEKRADMALSIAYYWHTQRQERAAVRYGRLALRLDPTLGDQATALMPDLDVGPATESASNGS